MEAFYYAFGEDDLYIIMDVPDQAAAAALGLAISAAGAITWSTTALLTPEEIDAAVGTSVEYRPPGAEGARAAASHGPRPDTPNEERRRPIGRGCDILGPAGTPTARERSLWPPNTPRSQRTSPHSSFRRTSRTTTACAPRGTGTSSGPSWTRPDGLVNQAHECIDRHAAGERANKLALIWQSQGLEIEEYTFADLKRETDRAANALRSVGIEKGDRVFFLSDRIPELYFGVFGALKLGALVAPLFSAFGPEPIAERVGRAEGKAMITTPKLLSKVNEIRDTCPAWST